MQQRGIRWAAWAALLTCALTAFGQEAPETKEQRDQRMGWWREAKFGMFIHWGLYAVPAGTWNGKQIGGIGEWIMNRGKIPVADYAKFAEQFNPVKFNAEQWVAIAKGAGMKYMVITAKHHDGFAMFHSQATPYNLYDATPFKRDPLAELAAACKAAGIKLGFYYSQAQDWHHPGGAASGGHWDKAQDGSMDEYIDKIAVPQVKELLSNYGEVPAVLWWDTPQNMNAERATKLYKAVHDLRPNIILNNRLGGGYKGDTETPEQFIPATGYPGRDWETCMTMNNTWGFKSYDHAWKPVDGMIKMLCDIASKGGNYLLNVGPTNEGEIPAPSVERLAAVGQWMAANGEAIYGSSASPFKRVPFDGRVTRKGNKLYALVFKWPADGKLVLPTPTAVTKAYLLTAPGQPLTVSGDAAGQTISLPATAPDAIASTVVAEMAGDVSAIAVPARQAANGLINLGADEAEIVGNTAKLETVHGGSNIGYWTDAADYLRWKIQVDAPGTFNVNLSYSCEAGSAGSEVELAAGGAKLSATIEATGDWKTFKGHKVGKLELATPGVVTFTLKATKKPGMAVANFRSLVLTPAK